MLSKSKLRPSWEILYRPIHNFVGSLEGKGLFGRQNHRHDDNATNLMQIDTKVFFCLWIGPSEGFISVVQCMKMSVF